MFTLTGMYNIAACAYTKKVPHTIKKESQINFDDLQILEKGISDGSSKAAKTLAYFIVLPDINALC